MLGPVAGWWCTVLGTCLGVPSLEDGQMAAEGRALVFSILLTTVLVAGAVALGIFQPEAVSTP